MKGKINVDDDIWMQEGDVKMYWKGCKFCSKELDFVFLMIFLKDFQVKIAKKKFEKD